MVDRLEVDMIVKAISEGFDKVSKDIGAVGQSYDKSGKKIVDASGKVRSASEKTAEAVVRGSKKQEQAHERMASKMAFQSNMIAQKYAEQEQALQSLSNKTAMLAAGYAAVAVAGGALLGSSIQLAARVETLGVVTVQLGKNVGMTEKQVRSLEQAIMEKGITMQAARQSLAKMVQAEIDLAYATDLARLAQDAAVIAGIDSSQAFDRLVTSISRGSVIMLRQLGIQIQFQQGYKKTAEQLGISVLELTDAQRVQSRLNQVMEAGTNIAGSYEAAMGTAGKKITSLNRHLEESRRMLGEMWLPTYANVIDALTTSLKAWEGLDESVQANVSSMLGIITVTAGVMAVLLGSISAVTKLTLALRTATITASLFGTSLTIATGGLTLIVGAIAALVVTSIRARAHFDEMKAGMVGIEVQARETAKWYGHYERQVREAANAEGLFIDESGNLIQIIKTSSGVIRRLVAENHLLSESEWETSKAVKAQTAILAANKSSKEAILEITKGVARGTIELSSSTAEYTEVQEEGTQAILDAAMAAKQLIAEEQALAVMNDMLAAGLTGTLQKASESYVETMDKLVEAHKELTAEKQDLLDRGYNPEGEKIVDLNSKLADNIEAQRAARTAIEETTAQMIYQQVAADLDAEAAIGLAQAMGLLSEQDAIVAQIASEATLAFDANKDSLINAGAEAEKYASFMLKLNDVVANLIQAGTEVTFENVAAAMAVASEKGGEVVDTLPDVVTGFEDVEVAAGDGVGKAEELFEVISEDSTDAIIKAGEVKTAVEEVGTSAVEAKQPFTDLWDHIESGSGLAVEDIDAIQNAIDNLKGKEIIIRIKTTGNIPEFQHGGDMLPGMLGIVGEVGPELFVAPTKGTIIPHSQSTTFLAGLNRQQPTQVVGVGGETNVSKDTYQDILVEGDTFVVEGGDLSSVQAVASTYKKDRLAQFVRG